MDNNFDTTFCKKSHGGTRPTYAESTPTFPHRHIFKASLCWGNIALISCKLLPQEAPFSFPCVKWTIPVLAKFTTEVLVRNEYDGNGSYIYYA